MRKLFKNKIFKGLPAYNGGKRKLLPWIFGSLNRIVPREEWKNLVFVDAFLGGGSVSLYAKAAGFKEIYSNDWSERSGVIAKALLTNSKQVIARHDLYVLTEPLTEDSHILKKHSPSVFSKRHAEMLDRFQSIIQAETDLVKSELYRLMLWHLALRFVCFSTSLGTSNRPYAEVLDGIRDGETLNKKRIVDGSFKRLCQPIWPQIEEIRKTINSSVFAGSKVNYSCDDAVSLVSKIQGDILYLDPPYVDTVNYESGNRILDDVLFADKAFAKQNVSTFSKNTNSLDVLFDSAKHIPLWVVSYGDKSMTATELKRQVKTHVPNRKIEVKTKQYTHMPHVTQNKNHHEILLIASE